MHILLLQTIVYCFRIDFSQCYVHIYIHNMKLYRPCVLRLTTKSTEMHSAPIQYYNNDNNV